MLHKLNEQELLGLNIIETRLIREYYNKPDCHGDYYVTSCIVGIECNFDKTNELIPDYNAADHSYEQYFDKYDASTTINIPDICTQNKKFHLYYSEFESGLQKLQRNRFRKEHNKVRVIKLLNLIINDECITEQDSDFLKGIFRWGRR